MDMIRNHEVSSNGIRKDSSGKRIKNDSHPEWPGTIDKSTSLRLKLAQCLNFKLEITALQDLALSLGGSVVYTPKAHAEFAGRGIEYAWGYMKLIFKDLNTCDPKNLDQHVRDASKYDTLDSPLNIVRIRKFARKARNYKFKYAECFHKAYLQVITDPTKIDFSSVEKQVCELKIHRSALDIDYGFIRPS